MNCWPALIALGAIFSGPPLAEQSSPTAQPAVSCLPTTTLDQLIKALDDSVSGPGNKDRTCMRGLMLPEARLSPIAKAPDGVIAPHVLTVDGWIDAVAKRGDAVFYECHVKVATEQYGHIAHLWSTYEIRPKPDGKATVRGINSIQAAYDGTRWKVLEILWQAETPAEPIPEKFLP